MTDLASLVDRGVISPEFADELELYWVQKSRILIVVDGSVQVVAEPISDQGPYFAPSTAFGIPAAIEAVREFAQGLARFHVEVATRNGNPSSPQPGCDRTGFRFDEQTLANFDQVWLFGFEPGNPPDPDIAYGDSEIERSIHNPMSDTELSALARWMDKGGGVFATGDHHLLGASMCYKVPRVAHMRAWTNADGAPMRFGPGRYTTTRPHNWAQMSGAEEIPQYDNEEDDTPQSIEWVPYPHFFFARGPHPILCHPKLGPINIMPDHMHEGRCYDFSDPQWASIHLDRTFRFAGYNKSHFPTVNGVQPRPEVISWGFTPSDPPLDYYDGPQPYRRFPNLAVYDGQRIGIGRVVVQSTWHHWFDLNLFGMMQSANTSGDRRTVDKLLRFFVNVGIYLASPAWRRALIAGRIKLDQFGLFGQQRAVLEGSTRDLGIAARDFLTGRLGPCWRGEFLGDFLGRSSADLEVLERAAERSIDNPARLFWEPVEEEVLGEVVRAIFSDMAELQAQISSTGRARSTPLKKVDQEIVAGARRGARTAIETHLRHLDSAKEALAPPTSKKKRRLKA